MSTRAAAAQGLASQVESDALQIRYDVDGHRLVLRFFSPFTEVVERPPPVLPTGPTGEIEFAGLDGLRASDFVGEIDDRSSAAAGHWCP